MRTLKIVVLGTFIFLTAIGSAEAHRPRQHYAVGNYATNNYATAGSYPCGGANGPCGGGGGERVVVAGVGFAVVFGPPAGYCGGANGPCFVQEVVPPQEVVIIQRRQIELVPEWSMSLDMRLLRKNQNVIYMSGKPAAPENLPEGGAAIVCNARSRAYKNVDGTTYVHKQQCWLYFHPLGKEVDDKEVPGD